MKEFVVSRSAAHPVDLADGRVVGPGDDTGEIAETNPHNKALIDEGILLPKVSAEETEEEDVEQEAEVEQPAELEPPSGDPAAPEPPVMPEVVKSGGKGKKKGANSR